MHNTPLDRRIIERAIERKQAAEKHHTTAIRVPAELWASLVKLKEDTNFSINKIMVTAICDLLGKETKRLGYAEYR